MGESQKKLKGKEGEQYVLAQMAGFADEVVVIVGKMRDAVEKFATGRFEELADAAKELDELESSADDTKEAILDSLVPGSTFPMGKADLARLVASMDGIANLASGAADRISIRQFVLPPIMNDNLVRLATVDVEAVEKLRDAVGAMGKDLRQAIQLARDVDRIESQADDVFAVLYQEMFNLDTDYKTFHQIKAIIERLENVADRCCENAELLRHLALEYLENE